MRSTLLLSFTFASLSAALLLSGCNSGQIGGDGGSGGDAPAPEDIKPLPAEALAVRTVDWNPSKADVGHVAAVAELGGTTAVLGDAGATVFSGGVVLSTDVLITDWTHATVIPAADSDGQWIAAVDKAGGVYRLRGSTSFEKVSDLYGLSNDVVLDVASLGGEGVVFSLDKQLAVSNGVQVTRYDAGTFASLSAAENRAVTAADGKVTVFDAFKKEVYSYDLAGAEEATFDAKGNLVVRTSDTVYIEASDQSLVLRYKASKGALRGLAAADERVWFVEGEELAALETDAAYVTTGVKVPAGATILGSPSGDVWMLNQGTLSRYAAETGDAEDRKLWETTVQPLYLGSCTPCHAPGGSAGIDLSTYGAWVARRDVIRTRVIEKKTMPPEGIMFTDAQRKVIADWVGPAM